MEELRIEQTEKKVMLSVIIPEAVMNGLNEVKWRDRKSRTKVVTEFLQRGISEKLGNEFINNSKTE